MSKSVCFGYTQAHFGNNNSPCDQLLAKSQTTSFTYPELPFKDCVRYIFASLFFKSKREHFPN